MAAREDTVYLIDGSAQLHRAYHAIRTLATTRGLPTGAIYGFTTMLRKLYQDEQPEWVGISFDLAGPTFRHEEYHDYKATRRKMDDDLAVQLPYVRRVCEVFGLPMIDAPGFEADDVIATLARQALERGLKVMVVTGDKDFLQMVSDDVLVLNPGREGSGATLYDRKTVEEKFGVPPERVVDVLALVGDAVDNVPGVPGIGEKGARDLVREFGSVEAVLDNAERVKKATYREGLVKHRDDALLSKRLVTLRTDVPVTLDLDRLRRGTPDQSAAHALFNELEFVALAREYVPEAAATRTEHTVAQSEGEIRAAVESAVNSGEVAVSIVRSARDPMRARIVGMALAWEKGRAVYIPLEHLPLEVPEPLSTDRFRELIRPLFENPAVRKLSARAKQDRVLLCRYGVGCAGPGFDAIVAAYLLNPGRRATTLEDLALELLGEKSQPLSPLVEGAAPLSLGTAALAAAQEADLTLRMAEPLAARLEEEELATIFETMELPLMEVLADMERAGVKLNLEFLAEISGEMETQITRLTAEIYELAGGEFNINSPVQLRERLFDKLGMRSGKKTAKTRHPSTAEEVLEELAAHHDLPRKILEYRSV
ncbi:MAG TPA: DNA polymerase, partial [Vicinamibacteria bacterium]